MKGVRKEYISYIRAQQPLWGQSLPIIESSQSHSDTAHSVGP